MNEQHELTGQLLHDRYFDVVYQVESVDPDAFPSEQRDVERMRENDQ